THRIRGARPGRGSTVSVALPLADDGQAIRTALWLETDAAYKQATEQLQKVQANAKVTVEQEDKSDDFSHETPAQYLEPHATMNIDREAWEARLRALSTAFRAHPEILTSSISLEVVAETDYFVSSEGTRYQLPFTHARVAIQASARADDGMELHRFE